MAPPRSLTLKLLRALARKHLGGAAAKLTTKAQLLAALKRWLPAGKGAPARKAKPPAPSKVASKAPARRKPAAPKTKKARSPVAVPVPAPASDEPIIEGFFVARVVSEREARRHGLTEAQTPVAAEPPMSPGYDEGLGELPAGYGDDSIVLLPRDPHTLFVFWDFSERSRRAAAEGLDAPRAVLRVLEDERLVREADFALESNSFYVHGLPPGRTYRLEAHFVGRDGRSRQLGTSTSTVALPRLGPSDDVTVRFLRLPWGLRLIALRRSLEEGFARVRSGAGEPRVALWRRVPLPGSRGLGDEGQPLGLSSPGIGASERHVRG
jgi:hypothetical protein